MSDWLSTSRERVIVFLEQRLQTKVINPGHQRLYEAVSYSILNGGKRIRACLVYAAAAACGMKPNQDLDRLAAAIECIHAYSLVHDDLPAMDNDELRRGKPTCHIAFDEAFAILAGDGLQSLAFELITETNLSAEQQVQLVRVLAQASGNDGMVGGQAIDVFHENSSLSLDELQNMHSLKTGALIIASLLLGGIAAGANDCDLAQLKLYGQAIGLAFQVQDDILDVISDTQTLGKTQGADIALNKPTYPALLGLDQAKEKALELQQQALDALRDFDEHAEPLRQLAADIVKRKH